VDDPVGFVEKCGLSASDKEKIMSGNAARLLKINPKEYLRKR